MKRGDLTAQRLVGAGEILNVRRHHLHLRERFSHLASQRGHRAFDVSLDHGLALGGVLLTTPLVELRLLLRGQRAAPRRFVVQLPSSSAIMWSFSFSRAGRFVCALRDCRSRGQYIRR